MGLTLQFRKSLSLGGSAPLPDTIPTFLALCTPLTPASKRPKVIVQLTAIMEAGRRKAHEYLPARTGGAGAVRYPLQVAQRDERQAEATQATLEVIVREKRDIPDAGAVESLLELTICTSWAYTDANGKWREGEERGEPTQVLHYYYGAWPDFGVPNEPQTILNLAKVVEASNMRPPLSGRNAPPPGNNVSNADVLP